MNRFDYADLKSLLASCLIVSVIFSTVIIAGQAYAETDTVTLTVTVDKTITMTVSTDQFGTLTPATPKNATSTLSVTTNDTSGWVVALSGDNKNSQPQNNLQLTGATSTQITDQTEWVPGSATTTEGNAVIISSFANSGNVLAFRVMSASSTNGTPFLATTWWGTADCFTANVAACLWAGIASSTVSRTIGNAGSGSYSASTHVNTVQYYLNVATTQPSGAYSAGLTYTTTAN